MDHELFEKILIYYVGFLTIRYNEPKIMIQWYYLKMFITIFKGTWSRLEWKFIVLSLGLKCFNWTFLMVSWKMKIFSLHRDQQAMITKNIFLLQLMTSKLWKLKKKKRDCNGSFYVNVHYLFDWLLQLVLETVKYIS